MQHQQLPVRPPHPKQTAFEFTKRKRWADLLVTELTEAIILILDPNCHILYCGAAVNELLGWRDDEVVDGDFIELINADDKINFKNAFLQSIGTRSDMLSYVRLIRKTEYSTNLNLARPKEVLFEIQGYAHFLEGENECACFFAMAKPHPSRNTAMLNTFLELKIENEKLQQRLLELKTRNTAATSTMAGPSFEILRYPSGPSSSQGTVRSYMQPSQPSVSTSELSGALYAIPLRSSAATFEDLVHSPVTRNYESAGLLSTDDEGQSEPVKKKPKKVSSSDQYVCITCGRTDSPEWRKGPLGPKTLCNACGLRWAKKMRKTDDPNEGGAAGHSIGQPI